MLSQEITDGIQVLSDAANLISSLNDTCKCNIIRKCEGCWQREERIALSEKLTTLREYLEKQ